MLSSTAIGSGVWAAESPASVSLRATAVRGGGGGPPPPDGGGSYRLRSGKVGSLEDAAFSGAVFVCPRVVFWGMVCLSVENLFIL